MSHDSAEIEVGGELFHHIFEHSPIAMHCVDMDGRIVEVNRAWEELTGYRREEVVGRDATSFFHGEVVQDGPCEAGAQIRNVSFDLRPKNGPPIEVEMDCNTSDGPGGVRVAMCVVRDVSDRNEAQRALSEREEQLRRLIERSPDLILLHREGRIVYANQSATSLLDTSVNGPLVGAPVPEAFLVDEGGHLFEARIVGGDRERVLELARIRVHFEGLPSELIIGRDLTERRSLQNRLAHADRLATVGTLAAGVAHEINNPLTYVLHYVERLRNQLRSAAQDGKGLDASLAAQLESGASTALEGCERVRDIVRDLKTFGRFDDGPRIPLDVNRAVRSALQMSSHQLPFGVDVTVSLGAPSLVRAHEGRLCQVFVNLLVNASQAIGSEGRGRVTVRSWSEGERVFVAVSDTGCGIEADHLGRLFEPFFSTKTDSVGTGLGLWICRDIVHDMRGHIEVESEIGRGSTFTVVLPAASARDEIGTEPPSGRFEVPAPTAVAARRILVVDDEPALRALLSEALSARADVLTAANGREARDLLEAHESFDVILCDLMMPDMSGVELYRWIREAHPDLLGRIVFMTGAAYTPRAREFLAHVRNERLDKPFRVRDLEGVLDRMLGPHVSA